MDLKELIKKFDHGDPLSDNELKYLIKKLTVLVNTLGEMNHKAYWLMYIDLSNKLSRCNEYMTARKIDRPRKPRTPKYVVIDHEIEPIVVKGYEGFKATGNDTLRCPHCYAYQEDPVEDHCVIGRPDNSKSTCIHCDKPFAVVPYDDVYCVVKLIHIKDNIN